MALSEIKTIDKIEVTELGHVQVRESTLIEKDGEIVAQSFKRWVLSPGDSLVGQEDRVKAIAEATWTPEVISNYNEFIANVREPGSGN